MRSSLAFTGVVADCALQALEAEDHPLSEKLDWFRISQRLRSPEEWQNELEKYVDLIVEQCSSTETPEKSWNGILLQERKPMPKRKFRLSLPAHDHTPSLSSPVPTTPLLEPAGGSTIPIPAVSADSLRRCTQTVEASLEAAEALFEKIAPETEVSHGTNGGRKVFGNEATDLKKLLDQSELKVFVETFLQPLADSGPLLRGLKQQLEAEEQCMLKKQAGEEARAYGETGALPAALAASAMSALVARRGGYCYL